MDHKYSPDAVRMRKELVESVYKTYSPDEIRMVNRVALQFDIELEEELAAKSAQLAEELAAKRAERRRTSSYDGLVAAPMCRDKRALEETILTLPWIVGRQNVDTATDDPTITTGTSTSSTPLEHNRRVVESWLMSLYGKVLEETGEKSVVPPGFFHRHIGGQGTSN